MTTTDRLVAMLRERHERGLAKYRVTVDRDDLTPEQWAQHAIEEMLDGAAYLMRLKDTMEKQRLLIETLRRQRQEMANRIVEMEVEISEMRNKQTS